MIRFMSSDESIIKILLGSSCGVVLLSSWLAEKGHYRTQDSTVGTRTQKCVPTHRDIVNEQCNNILNLHTCKSTTFL